MFYHKKHPKTDLYKKIALTFFIISLGVALVVFYISFSWATITITQKPDYFTTNIAVKVAENLSVLPVSDVAVAGKIIQTEMEAAGSFSAESVTETKQRVGGTMTLVNATNKDQQLRATTRLLNSDAFLFRTKTYVVIPAKGTIDVQVDADQDGDPNQSSLNHFILPGLWPGLQDKIYGKGFVQKTGGAMKAHILRGDDLEKAKKILIEKLKEKFSIMVDAPAALGDFKPKKLVKFLDIQVISVSVSAPLDTQTEQFDVRLTAKATGVLYDEVGMMLKINEQLRTQLSIGQDLLPPTEQEVSYALSGVNLAEKVATVTVIAQAGKILGQDMELFNKQKLIGLTSDQIITYFKSYSDITDVHVRFYPLWVTRAPLLMDHIHILMKK